MYVCVCVKERDGERKKDHVCTWVCVWLGQRLTSMHSGNRTWISELAVDAGELLL